jgi:hypothetical protein
VILPLLLVLQDTPPVQDGEDIVVIGEKLKAWRGRFKVKGGRVTCKTTKSTGDRAVDAIGCEAMVTCLAPIGPQFEAIANGELNPKRRDEQLNALLDTRVACLTDTRKAGIARLAEQRRGE